MQTGNPSNENSPLAVSVTTAARMIGVSRATLYREVERGNLRFRKIANRTVVRIADLERLLEGEAMTTDFAISLDPGLFGDLSHLFAA